MNEETFSVATPDDFNQVIAAVINKAYMITGQAAVVTLSGDLGAGKTTFTQAVARYCGITEPVVSPTFGIMKGYELSNHEQFDRLVHIDAYRIEDDSEVGPLRFAELFATPRTLIFLEWPEQIASVLPEKRVKVSLTITDGQKRKVTVS